jgi:coproporphyrinogen III oxidase
MILAEALSDTGTCVKTLCSDIQSKIVTELSKFEPSNTFRKDSWKRENNSGGGISCVLENGNVFEKAGVNISAIKGRIDSSKEISMFNQLFNQQGKQISNLKNSTYFATGISLVIHPHNPHIPTVHMNYRFFEISTLENKNIWWFGGGADLTPYFINKSDFKHFHSTLKQSCDVIDTKFYPTFKKKCDDYFYLPHRKEHRGIGGIFFDYLNKESKEFYLQLITSCSEGFLPSYLPLVKKNQTTPFSIQDKKWQEYRRGRYVEFNLIHDRGTLFGLKTNGRIESILMSLPKNASWCYDESEFLNSNKPFIEIIKNPKDWIT